MRVCAKCKQEKNECDFVRSSYKSSGFSSYCKECNRLNGKNYYYERGGMERKREYFVENRDEKLLYFSSRPYRPRKYDPDKNPARVAVFRAVKSGKLVRPETCSSCGKSCKPQAHHHKGYDKENRLDVVWLCSGCHSLVENPEFYNFLIRRGYVSADCVNR
jgi:hypothetical protein